MTTYFYMDLAIGWFSGAAVMWAYFHFSGLIRTREEFYAARDRRGRE